MTHPADEFERDVFHDEADSRACPDVTDAVMQRLGFARVDDSLARRRRAVAITRRFALGLLVTAAAWSGLASLRDDPTATRVAEQPIDVAVRDGLRARAGALGSAFAPLTELTRRLGGAEATDAAPMPVDVPAALEAPRREARPIRHPFEAPHHPFAFPDT